MRFYQILPFVFVALVAGGKPTEAVLAELINQYDLSFEIPSAEIIGEFGCPILIINKLTDSDILLREKALCRNMSLDVNVISVGKDSVRSRARSSTIYTLFPYGSGSEEREMLQDGGFTGSAIIDLPTIYSVEMCSQLEEIKSLISDFLRRSPKIIVEDIIEINIQLGFKDLFSSPEMSKEVGAYFYANKLYFKGPELENFLLFIDFTGKNL